MLSVLILTHNEQANLPRCLRAVSFSDDLHVLDSGSTDATPALAQAAGAHLTTRPFDDWSSQRNWALNSIPFAHPWLLTLDADEVVTPALRDAILAAIANPGPHVAFRIDRRDCFEDRWLRHSQLPHTAPRLFRLGQLHYERLVDPIAVTQGPVGQLTGWLDHYPFEKGIGAWVDLHNRFATLQARQNLVNRSGQAPFSLRAALFARDPHHRRFHRRELFLRLPARPLARFLTLYFMRRGFLDGLPGLHYAILQSFYEYLILLKTREEQIAPAAERTTRNKQKR